MDAIQVLLGLDFGVIVTLLCWRWRWYRPDVRRLLVTGAALTAGAAAVRAWAISRGYLPGWWPS